MSWGGSGPATSCPDPTPRTGSFYLIRLRFELTTNHSNPLYCLFSVDCSLLSVGMPVATSLRGVPSMKTNRFWVETVVIATSIACALALLIATLASATDAVTEPNDAAQAADLSSTPPNAAQSDPVKQQQAAYEGMVTCTHCGAKHSAKLGKTATDCTIICVRGGSTFSLVDGDRSYQLIGDLNGLKRHAGQRTKVLGVMHGDTITVSSFAAGS